MIAAVNKIYESYFEGDYPARSCVQVAKLPLGGLVEIKCVADPGLFCCAYSCGLGEGQVDWGKINTYTEIRLRKLPKYEIG